MTRSAIFIRRSTLVIALCAATIGLSAPFAHALSTSALGVASTSGGNTITMSNTTPATVATVTTTDAPVQGLWQMKDGTGFWGGTGSAATAFTPTVTYDQNGLGFLWNSTNPECSNVGSTVVPGTIYVCDTHPTMTFTFNREVTNPVISVADLAGGGTGASLWSDWAVQETGITMTLLSHASNFEVHSDGTSFGVIQNPGTGFTPGSGESAVNLLPDNTHPTEYGAGYGTVQLNGTFTSFTLVGTLRFTTFTSSQVTSPTTSNNGTPEGISVLLSTPGVVAHTDTQTVDFTSTFSGNAVISGNTAGVTYSVPTQPACGTIAMNSDGSYSFDAGAGVSTCTFTYEVCSSSDPTDCATSTITLLASNTTLPQTGSSSWRMSIVATMILSCGVALVAYARTIRRRLRA